MGHARTSRHAKCARQRLTNSWMFPGFFQLEMVVKEVRLTCHAVTHELSEAVLMKKRHVSP